MKLLIPYGNITHAFEIRVGSCIKIVKPILLKELQDFKHKFLASLQNPIGTEPLNSSISPNSKIVILLDDITRPGPKKSATKVLINYLLKNRVKKENIKIIFATGLHRKHTKEEWIQMLGEDILNNFKVLDHDADDQSKLLFIGETKYGTPVEVNKDIIDADVTIGISYLGIHDFAGYTGGAKIILPGVSSRRTINVNHVLSLDSRSQPGVADGNPAREDMEDAAKLAEYDFSINIPLNYKNLPVGVFSGDFIKAHREGIRLVDKMYKISVQKKVDVVIASAGGFPYDINLYQVERVLRYVSRILIDGGTLVLFAECRDGIGNTDLKEVLVREKDVDSLEAKLRREYSIGKWVGWDLLVNLRRFNLIVFTENKEVAIVLRHKDVVVTCKCDEILNILKKTYGQDFEYVFIPYGSITLPILSK